MMKKKIIVGMLWALLTLGQCIDTSENLRSLFDSLRNNDTRKIKSVRDNLEQEAIEEKKAFDTMKNEIRLGRQRNAYRRRDSWETEESGETAAKLKRESGVSQPVEQGQASDIQSALNAVGYAGKDITTMNEKELIVAFTMLASKYAECGADDGKFDAVNYCNSYRKEVERFEALFKRLIADAPSFNTTLNAMVPLFQAEREAASGQKRMNFYGDLNRQNWFQIKCNRVERWRVILTWFSLLMSDDGSCMSAAIEEQHPLLEVLRNSLENLKEEVKKDFETFIKGGVRYRAIENLPLHFKKEKFNVLSEFQSMSCSQFHEEIRSIGHGFHDGFQRCSLQVKKIEALKTPADRLFIIRARISGLPPHIENADDFVIHRCLSLMVEVGDNLRKI